VVCRATKMQKKKKKTLTKIIESKGFPTKTPDTFDPYGNLLKNQKDGHERAVTGRKQPFLGDGKKKRERMGGGATLPSGLS